MTDGSQSHDNGLSSPIAKPNPSAWLDLFNRAYKEWLPSLEKWGKFTFSRYFVDESLVLAFLTKNDFEKNYTTNFIDYSNWKSYYLEEAKSISCRSDQNNFEITIPYQEIIDYVTNPDSYITIQPNIKEYVSSENFKNLTDEAFNKFIKENPKTTDGPIVRISKLEKSGEKDFFVTLETSSYYEQVRTNLTLDYLMKGGSTLRAKDFSSNNKLPDFENSIMVNSIGVSAVVFFSSGTRKYFFMKLRKNNVAIFDLMFGTTSGVIELPEDVPSDLSKLASIEMLREFCEETGLSEVDTDSKVSITPLAFTRELVRGGKPQFFFLIEIPEALEKKFKSGFRSSKDGLEEFHDSVWNRASSYQDALSPEFATNLYYAYRYFNKQSSLPIEPVVL